MLAQHSMLHDLSTIRVNGKTPGGWIYTAHKKLGIWGETLDIRGGTGRSGGKKLFISCLSDAKYSFHIFCNAIYTWSLGANIFFIIFEEER